MYCHPSPLTWHSTFHPASRPAGDVDGGNVMNLHMAGIVGWLTSLAPTPIPRGRTGPAL